MPILAALIIRLVNPGVMYILIREDLLLSKGLAAGGTGYRRCPCSTSDIRVFMVCAET